MRPAPVPPRRRGNRTRTPGAPSGPDAASRKGRAAAVHSRKPRSAARTASSGVPASGVQPPGERAHERDFVPICGLAAVRALFARDPARAERLFFEPRLAAKLDAPRRLMAQAHKPYREVAADELARIAGTVRHGGVVAVARPRPLPPFDPKRATDWARENRPLLVLDGIGNPHNLGAILRSAAYFGIARAILAERPDQAVPSAASYRVAEGALEHLRLYRANLPEALGALRRGGFGVVGTAIDRAIPLAEFRMMNARSGRPVALVLGNEERGVDPATLALCDAVVTIPGASPGLPPAEVTSGSALAGAGGAQSLNVAAAAAILLYVLTSR